MNSAALTTMLLTQGIVIGFTLYFFYRKKKKNKRQEQDSFEDNDEDIEHKNV
mgnify:CR=1 FL=1